MKILIAGSTGMIGSAVTRHLIDKGHDVFRLVRRTPSTGEVWWNPDGSEIDRAGLEGFDGVVHLATMPWPMRWTAKAKAEIRANRLSTNHLLAESLANCAQKPQVLICASGMGIYPSSGDQVITEESPLGSDFLAMLQKEGEAAAMKASAAGIRVVNLRIPAVMGGNALRRNFVQIGNGKQWNSWIGRDELARMIEFILLNETLAGPINPVSPNPLRNAEIAKTFSRTLGRKSGMPLPAILFKLMLGEMAEALILPSRRMQPCKLLGAGYQFSFPTLELALGHELGVRVSS